MGLKKSLRNNRIATFKLLKELLQAHVRFHVKNQLSLHLFLLTRDGLHHSIYILQLYKPFSERALSQTRRCYTISTAQQQTS